MKKILPIILVLFCLQIRANSLIKTDSRIESKFSKDTVRENIHLELEKNEMNGIYPSLKKIKTVYTGTQLSIQELLIGKIAGLNIVANSGDPGAAYKIQSRGPSLLYGNDHPLVFLDGIPVLLQADEYGNFLNTINPSDIESIEYLKNGSDIALFGFEAGKGVLLIATKRGNSNKSLAISFDNSASISYKSNKVDVLNANEYKKLMFEHLEQNPNSSWNKGSSDTDWQDEVLQMALGNHQYLNVSGLIGKTVYRLSGGHNKQEGVLKNSDYSRWTAGVHLNRKLLKDQLKLSLAYNTSKIDHEFGNTDAYIAAIRFDPTQPASRTEPIDESNNGNGFFLMQNPTEILNLSNNGIDHRNWNFNFNAEYQLPFLKGGKVVLMLGKNKSHDKTNKLSVSRSNTYVGKFYNSIYAGSYNINTNILKAEFHYQKDLKGIISGLNMKVGYVKQKDRIKTTTASASQFTDYSKIKTDDFNNQILYSDYNTLSGDNYQTNDFSGWSGTRKVKSSFAHVSVDLLERLCLSGNYRIDTGEDWDERCNSSSIGLSYQLHKQSPANSYLNSAIVRVGYAVVGKTNDEYVRAQITRDHISNVGVDMVFFNHRLNATIEGYIEKNKNLPYLISVPSGSSYSNNIMRYDGEMHNKGIEVSLNAIPVSTDKFKWSLSFNVSFNENKIDSLAANLLVGQILGGTASIQMNREGKSYNAFNVRKQVYASNGKPIEGLYEDQAYDDRDFDKNSQPKIHLGFSSNVHYKNWDCSFSLRASLSHYVYNNNDSFLGNKQALPYNLSKDVFDTNFESRQLYSNYYVQDASFLRLQNLTMGYTLNHIFNKAINARIYATCENMFTITGYKGLNPEVPNGIDYDTYPKPRTIAMGVKIDF
ncbi:hypothetical protein DWB61_07670 [Ancylomarina euxinus]|uniref:TonB-dependent receptor plug domain-containing protein n=1 Tax=Ancylomarina euxinus TaxID=2283627 RepID=A0A425Y281_9BACT|nr:TonB-dependent receptor plug domain-containing protein [Ancylomarina euxinus]MCZ4694871.1 TonB-dependent receptor plug domain-containing protein [Ancylomarina euxinus]MUP14737.1 TonB-dependent receptor plug domain-containing protein [Ancylomarina euxinus]RRG22084.1 hypothetical protein DWB61_07670 [Ancylomarina euxinus]